MEKHLVLNELSFQDLDPDNPHVGSLLNQWVALSKIIGLISQVWAWDGYKNPNDPYRMHLDHLVRIALASSNQKDQARKLRRVFYERMKYFPTDFAREVLYCDRISQGFDWAQKINGVTISIFSNEWDFPLANVDVNYINEFDQLTTQTIKVRNVSSISHWGHHTDWPSLEDIDYLRILLITKTPKHIPASTYSRGKHVQGSDNASRKKKATEPAGTSQYFAYIEGEHVSDLTIENLEKEVLDLVRNHHRDLIVTRDQGFSSFKIYYDIGRDVGYIGGAGTTTSCIRVELSGWSVHSHPRSMPRLL